jgi:hypothetical protein
MRSIICGICMRTIKIGASVRRVKATQLPVLCGAER